MVGTLQALRQALEREIALGGALVPLNVSALDLPELTPVRERPKPVPAADVPAPSADLNASVDEEGEATPAAMEDLFGNKKPVSEDPSRSPYERVEVLIPEDHPVRDMKSLEDVEQYMATHEVIPLDKNRINPVFGTGDPHAGLMVIGEAPGADEDREGEPFVGRAGQLLNKILAAIHFKREDVYICNILKSRPPSNRDPEPEEIEGHLPFLYKQIALIKPKVILCVGKTAGNTLLGRRSALGSLRDKEHDFYGIPLFVTYHPAALLRNEQWKRPTWEDMKLLRTRYDQLVDGR